MNSQCIVAPRGAMFVTINMTPSFPPTKSFCPEQKNLWVHGECCQRNLHTYPYDNRMWEGSSKTKRQRIKHRVAATATIKHFLFKPEHVVAILTKIYNILPHTVMILRFCFVTNTKSRMHMWNLH